MFARAHSMKSRSISKVIGALMLLSSCGPTDAPPSNNDVNPTPKHFPIIEYPVDNKYSHAKAELGRRLFYDKRFSQDYSVSCGSCHKQEFAFSDGGNAVSKGFMGRVGTRNAMALVNVGYNTSQLWIGGVPTLEQQVLAPILHPAEFAISIDSLVERLNSVPIYKTLFKNAWGDTSVTIERITKSIAIFERRLISGDSRYDKYVNGDRSALSFDEEVGMTLFFDERGDCFHCHGSFNFTDNGFHNNGIDSVMIDQGRYELTGNESDRSHFRSPTLRNIALTSPYMHDGRFTTLDEVLTHYNSGGKSHPTKDPLMRPLGLSQEQKDAIIAFLRSLTDESFIRDTSLSDPWK